MTTQGTAVQVHSAKAAEMERNGKRGVSEWSLTTRVHRYFEANPGEWLTWEDACTKFGCTKPKLKGVIADLRSTGRIDVRVMGVLCVRSDP